MLNYLDHLVSSQKHGKASGVVSICSAHPVVLEAAMKFARLDSYLLIESTCNQVNQYGGYKGMKPEDFIRYVHNLAVKDGFDEEHLILGGDHLGPLVWSGEPAEIAMDKAKVLVRDYVEAGFTKIHLDASMSCLDDDELPVEIIARRTAELAKVAESVGNDNIRYVVGSEVPMAGGAPAGEDHFAVTRVESARETLEVMEQVFRRSGVESAWERVLALVVQPGVEFGDQTVHPYQREKAGGLRQFIESIPGVVYEAHSTDYQTRTALREMVEDHFAILKVGPALTFAFREAVFALAMMEQELSFDDPSFIREALESAMLADPLHWRKHYKGGEAELKFARQFSFSDRIRYYWDVGEVQKAFLTLLRNFEGRPIPHSLISQYLPRQYSKIQEGQLRDSIMDIMLDQVGNVLDDYSFACGTGS